MTKLLTGLLLISAAASAQNGPPVAPDDAVNPSIGTTGGGNTFPGASAPLGLLQ